MVIVHAGVKQGLDQREGKFGVLGTGGSILGLIFVVVVVVVLGIGTAKQSTIRTVRNAPK